jgi:hypothetical protein
MSPTKQDVVNTIAFWTGQLVLSRNDDKQFLHNLINLQSDLEKFRVRLVPPQRVIVDEYEDDDLVGPLDR